MSVPIAFEGTNFYLLLVFVITAADVVPCGGRKTTPRISSIVQIIFYFGSFEIKGNIMRIQKLVLCLEPNILDNILFFDPTLEKISH